MNRREFMTLQDVKRKKEPFTPKTPDNFRRQVPSQTQSGLSLPRVQRSPVLAGLEPYTGTWGTRQIAHLLRRVTFGAAYADVQSLKGMTMNQAVDSLLRQDAPPPNPVNDYNDDNFTDPVVPFGEDWTTAFYNVEAEFTRIISLKSWWLRNIIRQKTTIEEKMLLFWHNHIPVQFLEVFYGRWDHLYLKTLRTHALGNFKSLVKAVTLDPAMLNYLNGQYNSKWQPDENYARELQELFCIGKGPDAQFTEEDVQAMARVLTGHRVNAINDSHYFDANAHDTDDKHLSAFYNHAVITGRSGQAGAEELDDLLDIIFDNNETALFLCRKLYRFFIYHEIDQATEINVIEPLAEIFRDNNYEIMPVLSTLFRSQHFFDTLNRGTLLKGPTDFTAGLFREFNIPLPDPADLTTNYQISVLLSDFTYLLQQSLGDPPNVSGWPAYYQLPQYDKSWITTVTLPYRGQVVDLLLFVGVEIGDYHAKLELIETVKQLPDPADPNKLVDDAIDWLYGIDVSVAVKLILKSILLSGQVSDYYWTNAWNEYLLEPDNEMRYETVYRRLQGFFYYLLHLEEFQLS